MELTNIDPSTVKKITVTTHRILSNPVEIFKWRMTIDFIGGRSPIHYESRSYRCPDECILGAAMASNSVIERRDRDHD